MSLLIKEISLGKILLTVPLLLFVKFLLVLFIILPSVLSGLHNFALANQPLAVDLSRNKSIIHMEGEAKGLGVEDINHVAETENITAGPLQKPLEGSQWFGSSGQPYWTGRVIGVVSGAFLFLTVLIMSVWRYCSLLRVNEKLTNSIAKRVQAEKELLKQKFFLQKAQEIGQIATWELDVINNQLIWTDENYNFFGISTGTELSYETFLNCVHPDDRNYVDSEWKAAFHNKPYDIEHRILVCGEVRWVREKAVLEFNEKGRCIRGIGLTQDITDRKKSETLLRASEVKYRSMMEAMDDPAYVCSKNFRVEYLNSAMIKRIGSDVTGKLCYEVIHQLDKPCPWCVLDQVTQGESIKTEVVSPKDNRIYNISNSPIVNTDGELSKITVFHDITEKRVLERRLEHAQRMESIGDLAGGIAHDFNNLLFPIVGMSEMLLDDLPGDSPEHEKAREIFIAGQRGGELVKQILAFSSQSEHKLIPVRICKVLTEVLKLTRSTIPANIEIFHDIQTDCGLMMADPTQIHQIAMNLITNAYHAIGDSGGKIDVQVKAITLEGDEWANCFLQAGQYALIAVTDNGCGISPSIINKIFNPYFTTKEKGKGTGLGLAVVYGIVKEHKGDIKVYSEPGKGTTFKVYLPLIKDAPEILAVDKAALLETGDERILLVDDEEPIVQLEKQMLERLGYTVVERTCSMDALETFKTDPEAFDLVLTDMSMPSMTGDQLAERIISIRSDIPIIISTGFSERTNKINAEAIGVNGFLMKPVLKSELAQMVRKVLDGAKTSSTNKHTGI